MKVVYPDGSWFLGDRKWHFLNETRGTHHFIVLDGSEGFQSLKGKKIAVPVDNVKYFVLETE
jgi:hypothetical protein